MVVLSCPIAYADNVDSLPLGQVIKLKPSADNELPGAIVKVKKTTDGYQMRVITPEMNIDTEGTSNEPVGYSITVDLVGKTFTLKEESVPREIMNQVLTEGEIPSAIEGVDNWDEPESTFIPSTTTIQSPYANQYWYPVTTMTLTEDPLNADLCKTWTKIWVERDCDVVTGSCSCELQYPQWEYFISWAANPTVFGTHWFVRKSEHYTPTYELLPTPSGYSDCYWHFWGKGVYYNYDFKDKTKATVVKHFPHTYTRVGDFCYGMRYRGRLDLIYQGEAVGLLHTHFYLQGVKKY
ncbi:MAG: hypothetical protein ACPL1G_05515 [Thermodesulfovibrionales bacterium]